MQHIQISIGDYVRITDYGGAYVVEGTVITKASNGITVMVDSNNHLFFQKDYFDENVKVSIIRKTSDEVIVKEVRRITPGNQIIDELRNGDEIMVQGGQFLEKGTVVCQTYAYFGVKTSENSNSYFHWKDLGKDDRVTIIHKIPDKHIKT